MDYYLEYRRLHRRRRIFALLWSRGVYIIVSKLNLFEGLEIMEEITFDHIYQQIRYKFILFLYQPYLSKIIFSPTTFVLISNSVTLNE